MLPRSVALLVCLMLVAQIAGAAEIYGQLWLAPNNNPPIGAELFSSCGGAPEIDQYGRYRIVDLPWQQTCSLTVSYRNMTSNPVNVYTVENRNSANFMLRIFGERLLLIRR